MDEKKTLFRQEVNEHRYHRSLGTVRINPPLNYHLAGYCTFGIIVTIFLFFQFAHLSEQTLIRGYVDAESGIISVESENPGVVKHVAVDEGEFVRKGQELFLLSNPDTSMLKMRVNHLKEQLHHLNREYQIKEEQYQALHKLHAKNYVSSNDLKTSELRLLELKRHVQEVEYELSQTQETQSHHIKAPDNGTVTNIMYRRGQHVSSDKVLVQLVPPEAHLIARLYIPTRNMGFLKQGQIINVTYDAYPSPRFGFYEAQIEEINQTVLSDEKEDKPLRIGEPYYKIKARLSKPYVSVYGKHVRLTHGMMLTAIIRGEKKSIWQWILDPIYSYYGEHMG